MAFYVTASVALCWVLVGGLVVYQTHLFSCAIESHESHRIDGEIDLCFRTVTSTTGIPFILEWRTVGSHYLAVVAGSAPTNGNYRRVEISKLKLNYSDGGDEVILESEEGASVEIDPEGHFEWTSDRLRLSYEQHSWVDTDLECKFIAHDGMTHRVNLKGRSKALPSRIEYWPKLWALMRL